MVTSCLVVDFDRHCRQGKWLGFTRTAGLGHVTVGREPCSYTFGVVDGRKVRMQAELHRPQERTSCVGISSGDDASKAAGRRARSNGRRRCFCSRNLFIMFVYNSLRHLIVHDPDTSARVPFICERAGPGWGSTTVDYAAALALADFQADVRPRAHAFFGLLQLHAYASYPTTFCLHPTTHLLS